MLEGFVCVCVRERETETETERERCVSAHRLARYLWGDVESSIGDVKVPYH